MPTTRDSRERTNPPRLLDRVREAIRTRHYSPRTETAYLHWIRRFILFHHKQHPDQLGALEVGAFLSHLATVLDVSASTQNQALSALVFLYGEVLGRPLEPLGDVVRAKRPSRLPDVLTRDEVDSVLREFTGVCRLMASLMYGSGLRLLECCQLRVKDVDLVRFELLVRGGKGGRDRVTMLPRALRGQLAQHLDGVKAQHEADLEAGHGSVALPSALAVKYPRAPWDWAWQWVFPATRPYRDLRPASGVGIISTSRWFSARLARRCGGHVFRSARVATRFGIRLRHTFSRMATTSGPFRSYLGTETWRRR